MSEYMEGYEAAKEEYRPRLIEAEDEIARLRAENEQLRDELETFRLGKHHTENIELKDEIKRLRSLVKRARPYVLDSYYYGILEYSAIYKFIAEIDNEVE